MNVCEENSCPGRGSRRGALLQTAAERCQHASQLVLCGGFCLDARALADCSPLLDVSFDKVVPPHDVVRRVYLDELLKMVRAHDTVTVSRRAVFVRRLFFTACEKVHPRVSDEFTGNTMRRFPRNSILEQRKIQTTQAISKHWTQQQGSTCRNASTAQAEKTYDEPTMRSWSTSLRVPRMETKDRPVMSVLRSSSAIFL